MKTELENAHSNSCEAQEKLREGEVQNTTDEVKLAEMIAERES